MKESYRGILVAFVLKYLIKSAKIEFGVFVPGGLLTTFRVISVVAT